MEIEAAVAKVGKYATSESGDTVEMIERPHGGLSFVVADGQRSGRGAKTISNVVARKALSLLAEGVRDGAAARAAHDYLRTYRGGQVSATLNIVSVDLDSRTIVITRNSHCSAIVVAGGELRLLDEPSQPIGIHPMTRPVITQVPIAPDTHVVVFTDGVWDAGERYGQRFDVPRFVTDFLASQEGRAQSLADAILERAVALDKGRPADDVTVLVLCTVVREEDGVRRMAVSFPIREVR